MTEAIPSFAPGSQHFAHLAHEIRGPLMALAASTEVLCEEVDTLSPSQIREMATAIRSRVLWLQGLVENVLCAAAVQAGTFRLQVQRVSLVDVVDEVRLLLAPVLEQREQALRLRVRGALAGRAGATAADVLADGRRIGQVLVNFILNASKYAPRGTPIDVSLSNHGRYLRMLVADRGPGLPPGDASRLFEPFHRGIYGGQGEGAVPRGAEGTSQQPAPEGVGLGLAIARAIAEAHGARLGARNRRGGGAEFWMDLRRADDDAGRAAGPAVRGPSGNQPEHPKDR